MSGFDIIYRKSLLSKIFVKGWGNPSLIQKIIENHKVISKRETCKNLINSIDIKISGQIVDKTSTVVEGSFISPFHRLLPETMDTNNQVARFQLILPRRMTTKYRPLCIHYAGTGDHNFSRRRVFLANRLLKDGIASLIHINPYYGTRKPQDQWRSSLNYLSDLFVMGGALILEAQVLLQWATKQGFNPLSIHGISMGGHMACLGASVYPEPICLIPCLSWTTASHVFTEGALSAAVSWDILCQQYDSDNVYKTTLRAAIEPPVPCHLQKFDKINLLKDDLVLKKISGGIPQKPLDTTTRKIHLLSSKRGNISRLFGSKGSINGNKIIHNLVDEREITKEKMDKIDLDEIQFRQNIKVKRLFLQKELIVDNDAVGFMRDILDFFTHLGNYSVPIDTRLITIVAAENDAYIPIDGVAHFHDVWNNRCDIEILKGQGHVGTYLRNTIGTSDKFREAIVRTLNRYIELYHKEPGPLGFGNLRTR